MTLNDLLIQLQPALISTLSLVLSILIGIAAREAKQRFGLDIEARHREALHSALMSGARAAIEDGPGAGRDVLVERAVAHARASVPDAIVRLGASDAVLQRLAAGKFNLVDLPLR
ncbi:hypothetical protein [Antarcticimicrobium luteum]|uniref:Uncharacterized protein n=1 Tax=Antarcticimicrobium luteum TaxID=2547397 RepID=A0A4R5VI30_9RHOB|nr:hypothetical protein [Antarcticimicrobium luteum]TDK54215.1 hypothetical protein E1832_00040 [Antarcticimicrobium luteum]